MKRLIIILALVLAYTQLWAQNDSVQTMGMKVAGDSAFMQHAAQDEEEITYRAPQRNAIYYFGSSFAEHFIEMPFAMSFSQYEGLEDIGIGLSYTYLPEVWGGNLTAYRTLLGGCVMPGVVYRLSKPWQRVDWQAYANVGYFHNSYFAGPNAYSPAVAAGIRCGGTHWGKFSIVSGTIGAMSDFGNVYFTLGFNISWIALTDLLFLL